MNTSTVLRLRRPLFCLAVTVGLSAGAHVPVRAAVSLIPVLGTTTIPTQLDTSAPSLHLVSGSDLGVTWTVGAYPTGVAGGYRLLSAAAHTSVGRARVVLAGHTRYVSQGIPYASTDTQTGTDLDTGQTWTAVTETNATELVALLPHAALFTTNPFTGGGVGQLMISRLGGPAVPIATGDISASAVTTAAGDDSGALITWTDTAGAVHTGYANLTGTAPAAGYPVTALPTGAVPSGGAPNQQLLSVSPKALAYERSDGAVVRYARATLALQSATTTTGSTLTVATTDTGVGWETAGTPNTVTTCSEPAGSCAAVAEASSLPVRTDEPPALAGIPNEAPYQAASGLVAVGNSFAVSTGVTRADRAVRLLTPGAPVVGTVLDVTGPSAPYSVSLAPGRLLVDLGYENYEQSLTVGPTGAVPGPVTAVSTVEPATNIRRAFSGSRTAVALGSGTTCTLQVDDGGVAVARWTGLPAAANNLSFSGDRVVIPTQNSSLMFSVGNPSAAPVKLPANAVLFGNRVAYPKDNGIELRDLGKPGSRDTVIKPADRADESVTDLQLQGDWLYYTETDYAGSLFNTTSFSVADHLTTSGQVDRTLRLPAESVSVGGRAVLESGFVATLAPDLSVHLIDLSDGSEEVIGQGAVPADNGFALGASDDAVVWVGDDLLVHVLPIHSAAQTGPQVLGTESLAPLTVPVTIVFKAHGVFTKQPTKTVRKNYLARVDTTRPLSSWSFTLRDSRGHVVLKRTGRAPRGSLAVTWDGNYRGHRVPGNYVWIVTGKGPGGGLRGRDGRAAVVRGTFTVARPATRKV